MAIIVFEHHPLETPARLGAVMRDHGCRLNVLERYEGDPLPPDLDDVDGVLVMGGPMNVDQAEQYDWMPGEIAFIKQAHDAKVPIVGVCLGAQLIAAALGGEVAAMDQPEVGWAPVRLAFPGTIDPILAGIPWSSPQFHVHGQQITKLPDGATPLASSQACKQQAFRVGQTTYAFQYHFEWDRAEINRVLDDAGNQQWFAEHTIDVDAIRKQHDENYPLYRHLGDRLSKRLTDLLFALDRRLDHSTGPVKSYDPAAS